MTGGYRKSSVNSLNHLSNIKLLYWKVSIRLVTPVLVSHHSQFPLPKVLVQMVLEKNSVFPLFQKKVHVANNNLVGKMTARWPIVRRQTLATTRLTRLPSPSCLDLSIARAL